MSDDWRFDGETGTDAGDYFSGQRKRLDLDKRRPVVRRASDLVGPGIGASAVKVTNWNDTLATFNGYFSSVPGAQFAPNPFENFVGHTVMDSTIGGTQVLTGMASQVQYKRLFLRNPSDDQSIAFGAWAASTSLAFADTDWADVAYVAGNNWKDLDTNRERRVQYKRKNGMLIMRGCMSTGVVGAIAFRIPTGFLPKIRLTNDQHFPCVSNGAFGALAIDATTGNVTVLAGSNVWFDVSGMTYEVDH